METTAGQYAINAALPAPLRNYDRVIDKAELSKVLRQLATDHPDEYERTTHQLVQLGAQSAYRSGGLSFGIKHLGPTPGVLEIRAKINKAVDAVLANRGLDKKTRNEQIVNILNGSQKEMENKLYDESLAEGNPLAYQVLSGARGNKSNLKTIRGGDLLYVDNKENPIPIPIDRSYSEGLTPAQYFAATYGARKGVLDNKLATADSGFFCLAEGTLVQMADGTVKAINKLQVGDSVLGADKSGNTFPTKVTHTWAHGMKVVYLYRFKKGERSARFAATPDHKALAVVDDQEAYVEQPLKDVDRIVCKLGGQVRILDFFSKAKLGMTETFDIEVAHEDHLFVLACGVIVSNSKQMNQATHRLIVTHRDEDEDERLDKEQELPVRGLPVDTDDPDNEGSLLAKDIGPYKRNTALTPRIIADLKAKGHDQILVRSPIATNSPDGVYARDVGIRENGKLARRGSFVGLLGSTSLAEPLTQGMLCLAAGTLVRMANGSIRTIERIEVGDYVLGADKEGRTFPVKVLNVFDNGDRECFTTSFHDPFLPNEKTVVSTLEHRFLAQYRAEVNTHPTKADVVPVGKDCHEYLVTCVGDFSWLRSPKKQMLKRCYQEHVGLLHTYDLEVDHPDHLFVLANGIITKNSSKHSGGVAGQAKSVGGFALINQIAQAPKKFPGGATHSTVDGRVQAINPAPQGGSYIRIENVDHYVPEGFETRVKVGQEIEAGDSMTDGLPNPNMVVQYKGVGEGQRQFAQMFRQAYQDAGLKAHRRNVELVARGIVNHVRLKDEYNQWVPDDVVPYNVFARNYQPREGFKRVPVTSAKNYYLERPVLHYTIGTKVRPSVMQNLQKFGVKDVDVHADEPIFEPEMVRAMENMAHDQDWMTQMLGSYQSRSLMNSVHRGASSDPGGTSFVPALANPKTFGNTGHMAAASMDTDDDDEDF